MRNKEDWEILYTLATNEGSEKKDARYEQAYDNIVNLFYEKDKQIDLYIEELICNEFDRCCQECRKECEKDKDTLRHCIKQYFENKVNSKVQ